jgi:hypothetical protein
MPILHPKCFTENYLIEIQGGLKARDLGTLEKCVIALELVGRLQQAGLNFIFKGGTSLLLHLPEPRRLSIDVDIICLDGAEKLKEVLKSIGKEAPFTHWEHQKHRDREAPPTQHYQVYYTPARNAPRPPSIQIDVIQAENPYAEVIKKPLQTTFIEPEVYIDIPTPTSSCLLGDKLAAFAPSTIGYPYSYTNRNGEKQENPMQVVKHLFDVGQLAAIADNLNETIKTYTTIHAEQIRYRKLEVNLSACLNDTQEAALGVSLVEGLQKPSSDSRQNFFRRGIVALDSHLFTERFDAQAYRTAAARAALVAELVRHNKADYNLSQFIAQELDIPKLIAATLSSPLDTLNKIKKTAPAAFVCWLEIQQLRTLQFH